MISDLILIAKKFSVPSAYGRRDGVRDFFAQYPDGVYIATDAGAPAGWEGYAVWFGGAGERYAERFMELIRDGYIVERFLRARVGGLLVFTFRCRLKMRRFGTLGKPNYYIDWWGLKLKMPNGGTIILRKNGSPNAVNLEISTDGENWQPWTLVGTDYSYTLAAGQTLCIRNSSETATGFSTGSSDYYRFIFDRDVYASGSVMSLLCKNETYNITCTYCFNYLFHNCTTLKTAADLTATRIEARCYNNIYYGCSSLVTPPKVSATTYGTLGSQNYHFYAAFSYCTSLESAPILRLPYASSSTYYRTFYGCENLKKVVTYMTSLYSNSLYNWLSDVAAIGDFYCPAELTIPTGASGIPAGWTRHNI